MALNKIEKQVLERVIPKKIDRKNLEKTIEELKRELKKKIEKRGLPVDIELVGSTAKDTYLKDNLDIDYFLKFPINFSKQDIAKNALSIGKEILENTEESYAEHPYIRGYFNKYYTEIVPCYKIENSKQKLSAVDRTPLHTKYVIENITENQKNEIRLFKQFLIGINCYGAEAEIEGFSGYLCEILIIKYKTFRNLLKNAIKWKNKEKIFLKKGKFQDFQTPLTFIDPVDKNRNVASALSKEKFDLFIKASNEYLKKPKITFFFPNEIKPWSIKKIKSSLDKQKSKYASIKFLKPDIIDENLFPQIRKASKAIFEECKRYDFPIINTNFFIDFKEKYIYIIFQLKDKKLSKSVIHIGPPTKLKENSKDFIKTWKDNDKVLKGPYEKNGRLYVEIKRDYQEIFDFLRYQIKNLSLGKHIDKIVRKKYYILKQNDLLKEKLRKYWTTNLDRKMSWER